MEIKEGIALRYIKGKNNNIIQIVERWIQYYERERMRKDNQKENC